MRRRWSYSGANTTTRRRRRQRKNEWSDSGIGDHDHDDEEDVYYSVLEERLQRQRALSDIAEHNDAADDDDEDGDGDLHHRALEGAPASAPVPRRYRRLLNDDAHIGAGSACVPDERDVFAARQSSGSDRVPDSPVSVGECDGTDAPCVLWPRRVAALVVLVAVVMAIGSGTLDTVALWWWWRRRLQQQRLPPPALVAASSASASLLSVPRGAALPAGESDATTLLDGMRPQVTRDECNALLSALETRVRRDLERRIDAAVVSAHATPVAGEGGASESASPDDACAQSVRALTARVSEVESRAAAEEARRANVSATVRALGSRVEAIERALHELLTHGDDDDEDASSSSSSSSRYHEMWHMRSSVEQLRATLARSVAQSEHQHASHARALSALEANVSALTSAARERADEALAVAERATLALAEQVQQQQRGRDGDDARRASSETRPAPDDAWLRRDFALASAGARVVTSTPSRAQQLMDYLLLNRRHLGRAVDVARRLIAPAATRSRRTLPRWTSSLPNHPAEILKSSSSSLTPGHCWAFAGDAGSVTVRLARPARIRAFSLEHVAPDAAYTMASAPRLVQLNALHTDGDEGGGGEQEEDERRRRAGAARAAFRTGAPRTAATRRPRETILGRWEYNVTTATMPPLACDESDATCGETRDGRRHEAMRTRQVFHVRNADAREAVRVVKFKVLSNYWRAFAPAAADTRGSDHHHDEVGGGVYTCVYKIGVHGDMAATDA